MVAWCRIHAANILFLDALIKGALGMSHAMSEFSARATRRGVLRHVSSPLRSSASRQRLERKRSANHNGGREGGCDARVALGIIRRADRGGKVYFEGTLYLGESERRSHLFLFLP